MGMVEARGIVADVFAAKRATALADAVLQTRIAALDDDELIAAMEEESDLIYKLPDDRYTREVSLAIVAINGSNLQHIPAFMRDAPGFEREAALAEMWAFGYVSAVNKTEALLLEVIEEIDIDPSMIGESWAVPDDLLTPAVIGALGAKFSPALVAQMIAQRT
jgi:hypothetical protein